MKPASPPITVTRADLKRIPGPRGRELITALRALSTRPHEFLLELAGRYGPIVCMPFPLETVIMVSDADVIEYIFHHNYGNYLKQTGRWRGFAEIVGEGLFTTDGDVWRRQRQRVQPAFHQNRLPHVQDALLSQLGEALSRWRQHADDGTPIDLYREMLRLSLLTIVKVMFGKDLRQVAEPVLTAFAKAHIFLNPVSLVNLLEPPRVVRRILAPGFRGFERALRVLDGVVEQIVRDRSQAGVDRGDLVSMLIAGRDEEHGIAMTPRQVRDEIMTLLMAGHETVAIALTWTLFLLSKHPDVRRDLQAELQGALAGRAATLEDLPRLTLTRMVIEESMRLYPPVWGLDRLVAQNDVLGGYKIPGGATVGISSYVVHRLPAYWTNPEGFDPSRFSAENSTGRPQYAYLPFGGGARRCMGMRFAMVQMQLALATILQSYELNLVSGPPILPVPMLNFPPNRPILMKLQPRHGSA